MALSSFLLLVAVQNCAVAGATSTTSCENHDEVDTTGDPGSLMQTKLFTTNHTAAMTPAQGRTTSMQPDSHAVKKFLSLLENSHEQTRANLTNELKDILSSVDIELARHSQSAVEGSQEHLEPPVESLSMFDAKDEATSHRRRRRHRRRRNRRRWSHMGHGGRGPSYVGGTQVNCAAMFFHDENFHGIGSTLSQNSETCWPWTYGTTSSSGVSFARPGCHLYIYKDAQCTASRTLTASGKSGKAGFWYYNLLSEVLDANGNGFDNQVLGSKCECD